MGIIAAPHSNMDFRTFNAAIVVFTVAAAAVEYAFDPAVTTWFPSCPLFAMTGWLCPFCGSLRAGHALLHGHIEAALTLNPLTTAGGGVLVAAIAHDAARPRHAGFAGRLVSLCLSPNGITLAAAFGVLRNLPR